jgi:hypothetical protein
MKEQIFIENEMLLNGYLIYTIFSKLLKIFMRYIWVLIRKVTKFDKRHFSCIYHILINDKSFLF